MHVIFAIFAIWKNSRKFHAAEISCTRKFRASECAQIGLLLPRDLAAAKVIASYQMCMITGTSSPLLLSKVSKLCIIKLCLNCVPVLKL